MKRVATAAIATATLLLLSGCFLLPQAAPAQTDDPEPEQTSETAGAQVGDCWEATGSDLYDWATWQGDDPVDCVETHQTYTFVAEQLDDGIEAWDGDELTPEVIAAVQELCNPALVELGIGEQAARAPWYFFVASEDDWADGDHSIRCDVAVSAFDSPWGDPELENLPDDIDELVADVKKNPVSYELCLVGDGFGPYESTEVYYADCGDEYYWRSAASYLYDSELSDPYPSTEQLYDFADSVCTDADARPGEDPYYYVPSREAWESGLDYRQVDCWYSTIQQPSSAV